MPGSPWFRVPIEAARAAPAAATACGSIRTGVFSLAREERLRGILTNARFREIFPE